MSPESHVLAAAQQLATALKSNIPAGNETAEALKKVSKLFTKIAAIKKQGSKSQGTMQQSKSNPNSTKDNTLSKGGSINSKGGRRPRGRLLHRADSCKPGHTTASCACPRNTFPIMVTTVQRAVSRGPAAQLHLPGRGRPTPPPRDAPPDQPPTALCRKQCYHVWTYTSLNMSCHQTWAS